MVAAIGNRGLDSEASESETRHGALQYKASQNSGLRRLALILTHISVLNSDAEGIKDNSPGFQSGVTQRTGKSVLKGRRSRPINPRHSVRHRHLAEKIRSSKVGWRDVHFRRPFRTRFRFRTDTPD